RCKIRKAQWKLDVRTTMNRKKPLDVTQLFPTVKVLFMKIAEPRTIRVVLFTIYILMGFAGVGILIDVPDVYREPLALFSVYIFGGMIALGAAFSSFSVLPGIWWLERVGLILLTTGITIYLVICLVVGSSAIGLAAVSA